MENNEIPNPPPELLTNPGQYIKNNIDPELLIKIGLLIFLIPIIIVTIALPFIIWSYCGFWWGLVTFWLVFGGGLLIIGAAWDDIENS